MDERGIPVAVTCSPAGAIKEATHFMGDKPYDCLCMHACADFYGIVYSSCNLCTMRAFSCLASHVQVFVGVTERERKEG